MSENLFTVLMSRGSEQRGVEFKGPGTISDKPFVWKITRAILGMTNRQDGGYVVIGVREGGGQFDPLGLETNVIAGWTRDNLADKVAALVDPSVDFDLDHVTFSDKRFVLITVREFDETPVFCRVNRTAENDKDRILREGALYIRSRSKPETIELQTSQEMRDLLDLALRKRFRNFLSLANEFGVLPASLGPPSDAQLFQQQLMDLEI